MRRIEHFPFIITPRSDHTTNVLLQEKKSRNLNAQKEPLSHNYFQFFYSFFSIIIQQVTRCDRFRSNRIYSVLTAVEWPFQLPRVCMCVREKERKLFYYIRGQNWYVHENGRYISHLRSELH